MTEVVEYVRCPICRGVHRMHNNLPTGAGGFGLVGCPQAGQTTWLIPKDWYEVVLRDDGNVVTGTAVTGRR